jgi:hypothetical protein
LEDLADVLVVERPSVADDAHVPRVHAREAEAGEGEDDEEQDGDDNGDPGGDEPGRGAAGRHGDALGHPVAGGGLAGHAAHSRLGFNRA